VFLVSYEPNGPITDIWFSYSKDLRSQDLRLKLGYGPGGPPVLDKDALLNLLGQLMRLKVITCEEVQRTLVGQPDADGG
jgi:hypothetical protein